MAADHWCVSYADEAERDAAATGLLSEGLAGDEQVGFFGWGTTDELRRGLDGLGDVDALLGGGRARVTSLHEHFSADAAPDPVSLLSFWSDATDAARAAGFGGLRAVADTTPWSKLAHDQRSRFLRGEQLLNRYRLDNPLTLICASDVSALSADAAVDTAIVHPSVHGMSLPFRLYATGDADFALAGEVDAMSIEVFERALASVPDLDAQRGLVVDAADLTFIDHRSLLVLERHAEHNGVDHVVLRRAPRKVARLVELLGLIRISLDSPR